ncbi:hypothetical protein D8Y22_12985 [Salinadaptatus halalkaliphilus]|uniref:Uncharacterized protein n=1 Tax=Salinadaptatus halalkaliphilus TaxID=2419781 RepID=A0A4S3TMQ1_9EURY|nr:hypothetical protein [Salinadaptatus halalkaliphilus]THE64325.1 hypothetical protein D8Y22_12985 [Salinadaptatus halalkaliphilus]
MTHTDADPESSTSDRTDDRTAATDDVAASYRETDSERLLEFERTETGATAAIAQNREGYAMLKVRPTADGDELERYYGFDMALDHVGERLAVSPHELPVPAAAQDMGM